MTLLQAIFLGIVQGITEFLPVSSSGHLAIMRNIFHIDTGNSVLFDVLLHVATLLVVIVYFRNDIAQLLRAFAGMISDIIENIRIRKENRESEEPRPLKCIVSTNYRKFVILLLAATIPTGIIGVIGKKLISDVSETLLIPGICLLITGVLLFISDRAKNTVKIPKDITYKEAGVVGIAQGFATLPGLSRSGTTIAASLLCGFDRSFAIRYSFLLSIPAIMGAAVLELKDIGSEAITAGMAGNCIAGMAAAALAGMLCIRLMMKAFRHKHFRYFAYYCFAAGVLSIVFHFLR